MQILSTFAFTTLAWIFFRAESIGHALSYIGHIFSISLISAPDGSDPENILPFLLILIIVEWAQRNKEHALDFSKMNIPSFAKIIIYYALLTVIMLFYASQQTFLYFQF